MHPWISQAAAADHRRDLIRVADRRRLHRDSAHKNTSRTSLDARLGWLLIGAGCHLVALRTNPSDAATVRPS